MAVDYVVADRVVELAFGKFDKPNARLGFPASGSFTRQLSALFDGHSAAPVLPHQNCSMIASAGVEMWHRAIHSFLWSVALTKSSPLWASVSGYYASHFVMRAVAHSIGIFKLFAKKSQVQVSVDNGQFICSPLVFGKNMGGEHAFYWRVAKEHPRFKLNDLFRENSERDPRSDSAHRTFANYTDHLCSFPPIEFSNVNELAISVEKISRIRLHSVSSPSREDYPDLQNVQILAFQRILAFQDFLDEKVPENRFWRMHRRPDWCKNVMLYQVDDQQVGEVIDI